MAGEARAPETAMAAAAAIRGTRVQVLAGAVAIAVHRSAAAYDDVGRSMDLLHAGTLTRSAYEKIFLHLGSRRRLRLDRQLLTPVRVKGWYHSVFRASDGEERMLSIDQLLGRDWS